MKLTFIPITVTVVTSLYQLISAFNGNELDEHLTGAWKKYYQDQKGIIAAFQQDYKCCGLNKITEYSLPDSNKTACLDTYGVKKEK